MFVKKWTLVVYDLKRMYNGLLYQNITMLNIKGGIEYQIDGGDIS